MAALSALWRVAGCGRVYTVVAWLFFYPFAVTILGGYDDARSSEDFLAGFLVANVVHLLGGIGMMGGHFLERQVRDIRARGLGVIAYALALGACRPLLIDNLQKQFHEVLYSGELPARMATNVTVFAAALLVTASITTSLRHHVRVQRDLRAIRAAIESGRSGDGAAVDTFAQTFFADARAAVKQALTLSRPLVFNREREAEALRHVSANVVRPLSHLTFDEAQGDVALNGPHAPQVERPGKELLADMSGLRLAPAPIWVAPLLYSLLVLPYLMSHYEPGTILAFMGAGIAVGTIGNAVIERLSVSRVLVCASASVWASAAVLLFFSATVGALIALSSIAISAIQGAKLPELRADLMVYPVVALLVALATSGLTRLTLAESELAAAVREAGRDAARARTALILHRESLARLLHTGVQGELSATALRVSEGIDGRREVDAALVRVEELLTWPMPDVHVSAAGVREEVCRVTAAWGTTINIEFHADDDIWSALAEHPDRSALVVDALSEAFANIIRHADAPWASVSLERCAPGRENVRLRIRSLGGLARATGAGDFAPFGYGLTDLHRRAADVTLTRDGAYVVLSLAC